MKSESASYKAAGVDITAGYKAVELMKQHVARTLTSGVVDGIGGFGGLFELDTQGMERPVLVLPDGKTIVTNGDQTDTVYDFMADGRTFEDALRTRTFEDDAPNFTPRISGVVEAGEGKASYKLSILKSDNGDESSVQRFFFDYSQPKPGVGHFIHTYRCNGNPIPSFEGEPERVSIAGDIDEITRGVWDSLNQDNRVSLFVRTINIHTGDTATRIINKNS